jgi:hypothetical protein
MIIDTCVVASNLNDFYMDFFPVVNRCWKDICGIRCIMILISDTLPTKLEPFKDDIILFSPIAGVSDILVSQMIRLLYPCILNESKGVIISDIDLIPLNKKFYVENVKDIDESQYVVYRDVLLNERQIAMCFNGASPSVWREVWDGTITNEQTIRDFLKMIGSRIHFDGRPGYSGWFTDQLFLYDMVMKFKTKTGRVVILKDRENGFKRLDRGNTEEIKINKEQIVKEVKEYNYSDYHLPRPWDEYKEFIMYFLNELLTTDSLNLIKNYC